MMTVLFHPFPELSTERLLLRKLTPYDAPEIFFLRSDEAVMKYIDKERTASVEEAEDYIRYITREINTNRAILWGIALKENPDTVIGTICYWQIQKEHYRAELGYALHPDHWRKGIMKETIRKVLEYGFNVMQLHSIEAHINPANTASAAILKSAGFVQEGYFKESFFFRGKFLDTAVYSRLRLNPD